MTVQSRRAAQRSNGAPKGRDEVVAAVLESAADLFAQRGPAATSIREIAARSRVNHGLLHRHFGTKERLLAAVLDFLANNSLELIESGVPTPEIEAGIDRYMRVVARAALDGFRAGELRASFPAVPRIADSQKAQDGHQIDARLATAHALALELSWRFFGSHILALAGIKEVSEDQLRLSIDRTVAQIMAGQPEQALGHPAE